VTTIERLPHPPTELDVADLAALLADAVAEGAAVSFLQPLAVDEAAAWWRQTLTNRGNVVLVARANGRIVGSVQLHPAWAPNQPHRGDVAKLLVHREHRRAGLGAQLMRAIEDEARTAGRWLLVLDCRAGGPAERLYERLGWVRVGAIPDYAIDADRQARHATVVFYRDLRRGG
jgi:GNAT superfamily N-acetyltransferase